jgi:hypothetical protein
MAERISSRLRPFSSRFPPLLAPTRTPDGGLVIHRAPVSTDALDHSAVVSERCPTKKQGQSRLEGQPDPTRNTA